MKRILTALWAGWKYFAHILGVINTHIIMLILYFVLFGLVALILFILRKDLLERKKHEKGSFWHPREASGKDINFYKHQF
jgi:hypothetical protein